jgi:Cytochrome b5-like Heme/Steroid binding domain
LSSLSAQRRLGGIASHLGTPISISVGGVNVAISYGDQPKGTAPAAIESAPEAAAPAPAAPAALKAYTLAEVAKHNTEGDCWVVVNGQVLDATKFLPDHPGGKKAILSIVC